MKHSEIPARNARLCAAYLNGAALSDMTSQFGVCANAVYQILRSAGIAPKFPKAKPAVVAKPKPARKGRVSRVFPTKRETEMAHRYYDGETLHAIGQSFGLTRERVRQILKVRFGVTAVDSGRHHRITEALINAALSKSNKTDVNFAQKLGVSKDIYKEMTRETVAMCKRGAAVAYRDQKRNAKKRGIPFTLTFTEWWKIWQASGFYHLRGRGHGYVMARIGHTGGYRVGNVMICTSAQNAHDQYFSGKERKRPITVSVQPRDFGPSYVPDDALRATA